MTHRKIKNWSIRGKLTRILDGQINQLQMSQSSGEWIIHWIISFSMNKNYLADSHRQMNDP